MSATRKSRFKVAASIPVRRKPTAISDATPDNKSSIVVDVSPQPAIDAVPEPKHRAETPQVEFKEEPCNSGDATAIPVAEKPTFKRVKPLVNFPTRRVKSENANIENAEKGNGDSANSTDVKQPSDLAQVNLSLSNEEHPQTDRDQIDSPTAPPAPSSLVPPSPAKVANRPRFIRPALSSRRLSVHASSASESEDDNQRHKIFKGTDNVFELPRPPTPLVPVSETSATEDGVECARLSFLPRKKAKVSNFVRKVAEARRDFKRKFAQKTPERSSLKMFDLIFYNPTNAPLTNNKSQPASQTSDNTHNISIARQEEEEEEDVDNPDEDDVDENTNDPVPQVKIGANGEIILDEKSLVIETTASKKSRQALENSIPIFEDRSKKRSYYGKKNPGNGKEWTPIETKIFYRALNCLGTDFALMHAIFPERTRAELKNKFKREERNHGALVDRALSKPGQFNVKLLLEDVEKQRQMVKNERIRQLEEKKKAERESKLQKEALEKRSNKCIKLMEEFVGISGDSKRVCRPRRTPNRRYLAEDFVDPCSTDDSEIDVDEVQRNPDSLFTDIPLKETEHSRNNLLECGQTQCGTVGTVYRVAVNRRGKIPEVEPPPEQVTTRTVDIDSASCQSIEDMPAEVFMELMQENIQNSGKVIIRVEPPVSENFMRVTLGSGTDMKSRMLRVTSGDNSTVNNNINIENNFTINEELHINEDHDYASSNVEETITETIYTLQPLSHLNEDTAGEAVVDYEPQQQDNTIVIFTEENVSDYSQIDMSSHLDAASIFTSENISDSNQTLISAEDNATSTGHHANEADLTEFHTQETETNSANTEETPTSEANVNYRMAGGLQYAHFECDGSTPEQRKSYLAGLKPGSFVFMSNEDPDRPLERRCSMYMIAETVLPDGSKSMSPMPVVLPPDLMALIVSEVDGAVT